MARASKSIFFSVLVFVLVLLSTHPSEANNSIKFNLEEASKALYDKGYYAMSLTIEELFRTHSVSEWLNNSTLTVFCPPDHAFFSSKYPQPPLTLLQYHVVPRTLEKQELGSSGHGFEVDTLLLGHPLVVTTLPDDTAASLNGVKVVEWNIYKDEGLVVHGVDDFFDPAFQTLRYPWFDDIHAADAERGFSWNINWFLLLLAMAVLISLTALAVRCFCFLNLRRDGEVAYECLQQQEDEHKAVKVEV